LTTVFAETGGLPLAKRHPVRQAYRLVELQRWRAYRNIPLTLKPAHFPVNPELADRIALAIAVDGGPVAAYSLAVFQALWSDELDIAQESVHRAILERLGLNADATLDQASEKVIVERYMANQAEAIETGVFGSPSYVLNGEVFWGQDRLDLLDAALAEGARRFPRRNADVPGAGRRAFATTGADSCIKSKILRWIRPCRPGTRTAEHMENLVMRPLATALAAAGLAVSLATGVLAQSEDAGTDRDRRPRKTAICSPRPARRSCVSTGKAAGSPNVAVAARPGAASPCRMRSWRWSRRFRG
ncbi:MAG: 2-hydroxychromene-2-carboxylate isomerase, partial [Alphaproteobacteria bacterium]|nr:2-hydroxychromene-2-carboxylate isomerase [Alphaproteobacteria bacterium]